MQKTVKKSLIATAILGILFPSFSLLYVRKEGLAVFIMALFLISILLLGYTDITLFATSFWIFLITQVSICLISFVVALCFAWQGVSIQKMKQDKGLYWIMYVLLLIACVGLMSNLPVSFFSVQANVQNVYASDIVVVQKVAMPFQSLDTLETLNTAQDSASSKTSSASEAVLEKIGSMRVLTPSSLRAGDTVIFLDDVYQENIGYILATANDVLSTSEEGELLRNYEPLGLQFTLPSIDANAMPENRLLENVPETAMLENDKHFSRLAWLVPENTFLIRYQRNPFFVEKNQEIQASTSQNTQFEGEKIALLPFERITGKGIYVIFSKTLLQNGRSLTDIVF